MTTVNVGVGEMRAGGAPDVLKTILGSCMGIVLYDRRRHAGGLAHAMLPVARNGDPNAAKFVDSAVPRMVEMLERRFNAARAHMVAKLIGGATMFKYKKTNNRSLDIGNNNIAAARQCLAQMRIPLVGEDVGRDYGRRVEFHLDTGRVVVSAQGRPTVEL